MTLPKQTSRSLIFLLTGGIVMVSLFLGSILTPHRPQQYDRNIFLSGHVVKTTISFNHCFAILLLYVDTANAAAKENAKMVDYPFLLDCDTAEVYTTCCEDITGGIVEVNGRRDAIVFKDKNGKETSTGYFTKVNSDNRSFIREHSEW